jgi:hypothetical protein
MTRARILADYVSSGDELALKAPLISPALVTPNLGIPSAGTMTNVTGIPAAGVTGTLAINKGGTGAATHTANNVLIGAGTSAITSIAPGADGQVLTSTGSVWQSEAAAAAGGGKLLQVQEDSYTGQATICPSSFVIFDSGFKVTITPASGNHVLLLVTLAQLIVADWAWFDIRRSISGGAATDNLSGESKGICGTRALYGIAASYMYLDQAVGTGAAIEYSPTARDDDGSEIKLNFSADTQYSNIIAIEIAA